MNQVAILYPVFVQVLLVVVVGMSMAASRARAVKTMDRERGNPDLAMGRFAWPDDAAKRAANYRNQFEAPVLFYAVVAFDLCRRRRQGAGLRRGHAQHRPGLCLR